ncbi:MAG TPA: FAD-dependent oxidoreductase, partial [Casimicrobiaceae bacterium]
MRQYGCDRVVRSPDECVAVEPALAACRDRLAGGIYTASDETGDAHVFTVELAGLASARGATFRWSTHVERFDVAGDAVTGVRVRDAGGREETLAADAIVCALGSYSPLVLSTIGVPCSVYPAKGYSITLDVGAHRGAPTVSLTDLAWKIVMTRLGSRLRVAGTAELNGWDTSMNERRCGAL